MGFNVFTDGGICLGNPSTIGGSWCVIGRAGQCTPFQIDGSIVPSQLGLETVESNLMETIAVAQAMQALAELPAAFVKDSVIHCDNLNAIRRGQNPLTASMGGVPPEVQVMLGDAYGRLWGLNVTFKLVAGKGNRKEVAAGFRKSDGKPLFQETIDCHRRCQAICGEMVAAANGFSTG